MMSAVVLLWLRLYAAQIVTGLAVTGSVAVGVQTAAEPDPDPAEEVDAPAAPSSVCGGLPGAYPVQVGDAWDCYGGDRELLSRVNP